MTQSGRFIVAFAAFVLTTTSIGRANIASFQALGSLPGTNGSSHAADISSDGLVVVGNADAGNTDVVFRWTEEGGMIGLGTSPGSRSQSTANALSGDGLVIVGMGDDFRAFRWTESTGMVRFGQQFTDGYGLFFDLTYDGSVMAGVHYYYDSPSEAIMMSASGEVTVMDAPRVGTGAGATAITADGTVVAGVLVITPNQYTGRWTADAGWAPLGDLAGGSVYGVPSALSSDGSVIVGESDSSSGSQAFRWTKETGMVGLGYLTDDANNSKAHDVSADGSVVVGSSEEAFIWTADDGMRSLKDVLVDTYGLDLTGWRLYAATGISADGTRIVGGGVGPDGIGTAFLVTIPEPGTMSVLGFGFACVMRRRG